MNIKPRALNGALAPLRVGLIRGFGGQKVLHLPNKHLSLTVYVAAFFRRFFSQ